MTLLTERRTEYEDAHRQQARWASTLHDAGYLEMAADYAEREMAAQTALNSHNPADSLGIQQLQLSIQHFGEVARYADERFRRATADINGTE